MRKYSTKDKNTKKLFFKIESEFKTALFVYSFLYNFIALYSLVSRTCYDPVIIRNNATGCYLADSAMYSNLHAKRKPCYGTKFLLTTTTKPIWKFRFLKSELVEESMLIFI